MGQDVERGQGSRSNSVIRGQPGFSESKEIEREVGGKGRYEISQKYRFNDFKFVVRTEHSSLK